MAGLIAFYPRLHRPVIGEAKVCSERQIGVVRTARVFGGYVWVQRKIMYSIVVYILLLALVYSSTFKHQQYTNLHPSTSDIQIHIRVSEVYKSTNRHLRISNIKSPGTSCIHFYIKAPVVYISTSRHQQYTSLYLSNSSIEIYI